MSLSATPQSERVHIAVFGRRNVGKSSLVNALTGQQAALVSPVPGTTTDPVRKAMELQPLGPVVFIDTAGLDDQGPLGELRVRRSMEILSQADIALLITEPGEAWSGEHDQLLENFRRLEIPHLVVINKSDTIPSSGQDWLPEQLRDNLTNVSCGQLIGVSALTGEGIITLRERLAGLLSAEEPAPPLVEDLIEAGDLAVMVVPIDKAAPKGRLILPQVITLRAILDRGALAMVVRDAELPKALAGLSRPPRLVITDSQAFKSVADETPLNIPFTSFSILFARYRGDLPFLIEGVVAMNNLTAGDRVLIAEACTHHPTCDDIGRVKIPGWLDQLVGGGLELEVTSGGDFPEDLTPYRLVIHCGGCMINRRTLLGRLRLARAQGVPVVNYGLAIAAFHGVLSRALAPLRPWLEREGVAIPE